jgi:hypothetical protein
MASGLAVQIIGRNGWRDEVKACRRRRFGARLDHAFVTSNGT